MNRALTIILAIVLTLSVMQSNSSSLPRSIGNESRIKIINYMPNTVFKFVGHYFYQSIIEFALDEEIETISMGSPSPWQIVPAGNRIFLKPVGDEATTNMTVITNRRMYFFEMHAEDAEDISDDKLSFIVKFVYPGENNYQAVTTYDVSTGPDLSKPEKLNFKYVISGEGSNIEPLQVFDDGEFTYFKFRDINAELPAVFLVDREGYESLVNYRISKKYVVVEQVAEKFTLRHGPDIICIYNEARISEMEKKGRNKPKRTGTRSTLEGPTHVIDKTGGVNRTKVR